ncbi:mandelate racemase/muconate lactonizing enzyme family protein [Actinopolymorpha alba]|uniref:mandelate racemase/muconate lactonizing enzyme family protein n=1 Tax=Actinopolymorpha alba TaxID=533267 RepID=UPI0003804364|nr:enolase C-terminal domain-like protein [Actinopolymorpha alba]
MARSSEVAAFSVHRIALPLRVSLRHARVDAHHLDEVFVNVRLRDGGSGWAEIRGNGAYATGETADDVLAAYAELAAELGPPAILPRLLKRSRLAAMGFDLACRDAAARQAGVSFAQHLGHRGQVPIVDAMPTHAQIGFGTPEEAAARAAAAVAEGFARIKVRVGHPQAGVDADRLAAVRAAAGPRTVLLADANGAWDVERALAALPWLVSADVAWIEQPTPAGDDDAMARVRAAGKVPVYADESAGDASSVRRLAAAGAVNGVHLKLEKCGTVDELFRAVEVARELGLGVALGQMDCGRLGCAATTQLAVALDVEMAELWGCANVAEDVAGPLELRAGAVVVPRGVGLGVNVNLTDETLVRMR